MLRCFTGDKLFLFSLTLECQPLSMHPKHNFFLSFIIILKNIYILVLIRINISHVDQKITGFLSPCYKSLTLIFFVLLKYLNREKN